MAKKPSYEEFEQSIKELGKDEALRALLNATIESTLLISMEGKILAINQVAAQRLGKSADELVGLSVDDYLPPDVAKSKKMIWRGVAKAEINSANTPEKREKLINEAVHEILKNFPPVPSK